jgi:hypothetical protein
VHHDVVDGTFSGLAPAFMTLHDAVSKAVLGAEHGDRRIVSWSQYDLEVVRTLRDDGGAKATSGRLADYLTMIGYPVPEEAAPGQVGETIRVVRHRLERGLHVTAAQLARWRRLVEHNRHDCAGMRRVCILATKELDATARPARSM